MLPPSSGSKNKSSTKQVTSRERERRSFQRYVLVFRGGRYPLPHFRAPEIFAQEKNFE
jgi:hypothetical protein